MKLPWRDTGGSTAPQIDAAVEGQKCPTLARAVAAIGRRDRPSVLDLGPMCGDTVVYFADQGARVTVEDFEVPLAAAAADSTVEDAKPAPICLDQPDACYDLVIAWEWCDFVAPEQLAGFCAELRRVLKVEGWLLVFSLNAPPADGESSTTWRYRVVGDDRLVRESVEGPSRQRWQYPTRRLEMALEPLSIQTLHLQRNQIREFLAQKPKSK